MDKKNSWDFKICQKISNVSNPNEGGHDSNAP